MRDYPVVWAGRGPLPGMSGEGWQQRDALSHVLQEGPVSPWQYQADLRERRKAAGLCVSCAEPSHGMTRCAGCRAYQNQKLQEYRKRNGGT